MWKVWRVNRKGDRVWRKFGLWIEPEMVSENSELYRAHPDWAMRIPGRKPIRGRNQLMLDFSREDVRGFIFERICDILDQGNIEYVKWDMNRSIAEVYSAVNYPGRVAYDYMLGVYDFLEKLLSRYPNLFIEGSPPRKTGSSWRVQYPAQLIARRIPLRASWPGWGIPPAV